MFKGLMWPDHEAVLNVVAQKQISVPAGNRISLLLRVLKHQTVYHSRGKKKNIPALCFEFEIGNQFPIKRHSYSCNIPRPFHNLFHSNNHPIFN